MSKFKVGDTVIRIRGEEEHSLQVCGIGEKAQVKRILPCGKLFDSGIGRFYLRVEDFELADNKCESVDVLKARLEALKQQTKNEDLVLRVKDIINDLTSLEAEIGKQVPELKIFLKEVEEELEKGEFTVEQLRKLIAIAQVDAISGVFFHSDGSTEDLVLNYRGSLRPPVNVWQDGDTLDIDNLVIRLKVSPTIVFSTDQSLALLKSL